MTVAELIEELRVMSPDLAVVDADDLEVIKVHDFPDQGVVMIWTERK